MGDYLPRNSLQGAAAASRRMAIIIGTMYPIAILAIISFLFYLLLLLKVFYFI
jgi:hypothetical protein